MGYIRYHVDCGDARTTVSLDETLAALMAFALGSSPDADDAHATVREWLQNIVDQRKYRGRFQGGRLSATLREHAVTFLVDKKLSKRYWDWRLAGRRG